MAFISLLLFRFLRSKRDGRRRGKPRTAERSNQAHSTATTLEKLPVELLQHIAAFLGPDSAACFVLCSRSLQWAVGNQSWFALRTKDQKKARISFLNSLQRDLRDWLTCYHCLKLHPFDPEADPQGRFDFAHGHPCSQADGVVQFMPGLRLQFPYAQMIMKAHKLGATDNVYLDSLSHAHTSDHEHQIPHGHTSARIVNNSLLVKLDWRIPLRLGEGFSRARVFNPNVCRHWRCVLHDDNLSERIRCQLGHGLGQSCAKCTGLQQCQRCSTEFVMGCLDSNWSPQGRVIYITAWRDLGPCDTPFDTRWRSQIMRIYTSLPAPDFSVPFVPGSIRRAFEDSARTKIKVDGLSSIWPLDSDVRFSKLIANMEQ